MTALNYFKEASQHFGWDPEDNQIDYKVEMDEAKFRHVVKRYIKNEHSKHAEEIESITGDTLYKALDFKVMPGINQLLLLNEKMSVEEFVELYKDGLTERGKYKIFVRDSDGKKFIEDIKQTTEACWKYHKEVFVPKKDGAFILSPITGAKSVAIDTLLKDTGNPDWDKIINEFDNILASESAAIANKKDADKKVKELDKELSDIKSIVADMKIKALSAPMAAVELPTDGTVPDGRLVMKKASEVFDKDLIETDFDIPTWEWDDINPFVPRVDEHYIFRKRELGRVLLALTTNRRMYLHGHTGSGKTTLLEQVAARIGYMFSRINFDSEITRPDLIGRDTLKNIDGKQVSVFEDGILPKVMSGPFLACFDEIDFARPDVAYVMQAALEGNALRIMEDGDRIVQPHPYFRMFATGNTVGQGDEHGLYQGARVQSLAFMNRFNLFAHVEYLNKKEREQLVERMYPELSINDRKQLMNYVTEHLAAFEKQEITLPISPRGFLGAALTTTITGNLKEALIATFVDSASQEDRGVLNEIIDRVVE